LRTCPFLLSVQCMCPVPPFFRFSRMPLFCCAQCYPLVRVCTCVWVFLCVFWCVGSRLLLLFPWVFFLYCFRGVEQKCAFNFLFPVGWCPPVCVMFVFFTFVLTCAVLRGFFTLPLTYLTFFSSRLYLVLVLDEPYPRAIVSSLQRPPDTSNVGPLKLGRRDRPMEMDFPPPAQCVVLFQRF